MKILHIISSLDEKYGGPSILLPELCIRQKENNIDINIITTYLSDESLSFKDKLLNRGINLKIFKVFTKYRFSINLILWFLKNLRNYEVIHIHGIYRFPVDIAFIIAFLYRNKFVFSPHGSLDPYLFNRSDNKLIGFFLKKLIHLILYYPLKNAFFHFTAEDEKRLCMLKNIVSKSFIIPPIAFEIKEIGILNKNYLKSILKISKETFLIGYIGRLHEKKNIDSLIKAFNKISLETKADIGLFILGPGRKEYRNYLEKIIDATQNNKIFLFDQKPHSEIKKFMYGLDLYALPSHSENFGITIIEALSVGTPVLISDKVNIHQNIKNYNCGKIVKNDLNSIIAGLSELINNPKNLKLMKKNSFNFVKSEYSWDYIIPKYKKMYESLEN